MKTTKKTTDLGGDRVVVLTNGSEYVTQFNTTFAIVQFGQKDAASRLFLKDAVEVIRDLGKYGVHRLYAEVV